MRDKRDKMGLTKLEDDQYYPRVGCMEQHKYMVSESPVAKKTKTDTTQKSTKVKRVCQSGLRK